MLKFNKIYKQYETPILGPINLEIEKVFAKLETAEVPFPCFKINSLFSKI